MRNFRSLLPPLNFITIHYTYFIIVPLVASLVFWGSSDPKFSISYVDSLFLVISAMTEAGLNTVNLSQMTTWQQVLLWFLIIIGSSIWVSIWTVLVRKHAFEARFAEIVRKEQRRRLSRRNASLTFIPITERLRSIGKSRTVPNSRDAGSPGNQRPPANFTHSQDTRGGSLPVISDPSDGRLLSVIVPPHVEQSPRGHEMPESPFGTVSYQDPVNSAIPAAADTGRDNSSASGNVEHVAFVDDLHAGARSTSIALNNIPTQRHLSTAETVSSHGDRRRSHHSHLGGHKVGRNSQFHGLTADEREELGGTEYRALKLLSIIVPLYWFLWQFLGCVSLGAWLANNQPEPALSNAISPWWNGIFNGVSAFNNSGMSVLDLNMIPYGSSYFVLVVMGAMILAGNTAYPIFLRSILWCSCKLKFLAYLVSFRRPLSQTSLSMGLLSFVNLAGGNWTDTDLRCCSKDPKSSDLPTGFCGVEGDTRIHSEVSSACLY